MHEECGIFGIHNHRQVTQARLTSVALPMGEIGRVVVRILLDRIEGKDSGGPKKVLLPEKLIMRDSTARSPTKVVWSLA